MYEKFFGIRENPFAVSPDPRFLVPTQETNEAFASLTYCVTQRRGFVLLSGEVGTGKTTILNKFLEWLAEARTPTAFVFNPRLNVSEFLDFVLADFGIPCDSDMKSRQLIQLNRWLVDRYRVNETAVLIVDEAQNLSTEVLEEIRLLTNLETSRGKLLQIVLAGQPELESKLRHPDLRQLRQRITLRCRIASLTLKQVEAYINERLRIAGLEGRPVFSLLAVKAIYDYSQGIPRLINLICDQALIAAYAEGRRWVPEGIIHLIGNDFDLFSQPTSVGIDPTSGIQAREDAVREAFPDADEQLANWNK